MTLVSDRNHSILTRIYKNPSVSFGDFVCEVDNCFAYDILHIVKFSDGFFTYNRVLWKNRNGLMNSSIKAMLAKSNQNRSDVKTENRYQSYIEDGGAE